MARTTDVLVKEVIETDDIEVPSLTPFINAAAALVARVCEPEYDLADADDIDLLTQIETWLAAHFYAIRDNRVAVERTGTAIQTQYQYKVGLMLAATMYGQQAMMLDTSGALAALSKALEKGATQEVSLIWLGTEEETIDISAD
jgi:hypothetical protein